MILSAQKYYIPIPTRSCHAGTVARLNGKTFLAWFGGTRESAADVDIYYTFETPDGFAPATRVSAGDAAHWNPVLLPRDGGLDLFFKFGSTIPAWRTMRARIGADGGLLDGPRELVPGDVGGRGPVKNKCLTLKSGRVLAPCSLEKKDPDRWEPFVDISDDGGATFGRMVPIPLYRKGECEPQDHDKPWCVAEHAGAIQPTLWQSGDGAVHALMRSSEGFILRSDSTDDGETWCPAYSAGLPNNNSGIDLVRLADGRILLCLNPVSGNWAARSPLALCVSRDDGASFTELLKLELQPGEYSYPALVAEGEKVYLIYTWNRRCMAFWEIELEPLEP